MFGQWIFSSTRLMSQKNEYQTLVMSNVILVSVIVHCVEFTELFIGPQHRSLG